MSSSHDVVGVYDEAGTQVFPKARAMQLQVTPDSQLMKHPVEDGSSVVDHRILLPIEGQLRVTLEAVNYKDAYSQIRAIFASGKIVTLQCKAASYPNMYLAAMPHEESPDKIDAIDMIIKVVEVKFFKSQATASGRSRRSKSGNTIKRGEQSTAPRDSTLYKGREWFRK